MDEAATCRSAAVDAVDDVYPARLRDDIVAHIDAGSHAPGTLAIRCARAVDDTTPVDAYASRAAGVQLIYDGLRLTRTLAHTQPWVGDDDQTQPNLDILAADVLVARGFYLLARTQAAGKAVEAVRTFGREQTHRRIAVDRAAKTSEDDSDAGASKPDTPSDGTPHAAPDGNGASDHEPSPSDHDRTLERDVLELAALAGITAADATPTPDLYSLVDDHVTHATPQGFPTDLDFLPTTSDIRGTLHPNEPTTDDGVPQSAGDS